FLKNFAKEHDVDMDTHVYMDSTTALFELMQNASSYDLLIFDVRMSGVSGIEIYKTMKQLHTGICAKILFITGHRQDLLIHFPHDQLNILDKPFSYKHFSKEINRIRGLS
ncbi:MAG: response regulator, partial [Mariprofundaceae bacterium]|nr:response regulator [Mariprofundaceae bacterium]